jgi:hypothetical protein
MPRTPNLCVSWPLAAWAAWAAWAARLDSTPAHPATVSNVACCNTHAPARHTNFTSLQSAWSLRDSPLRLLASDSLQRRLCDIRQPFPTIPLLPATRGAATIGQMLRIRPNNLKSLQPAMYISSPHLTFQFLYPHLASAVFFSSVQVTFLVQDTFILSSSFLARAVLTYASASASISPPSLARLAYFQSFCPS